MDIDQIKNEITSLASEQNYTLTRATRIVLGRYCETLNLSLFSYSKFSQMKELNFNPSLEQEKNYRYDCWKYNRFLDKSQDSSLGLIWILGNNYEEDFLESVQEPSTSEELWEESVSDFVARFETHETAKNDRFGIDSTVLKNEYTANSTYCEEQLAVGNLLLLPNPQKHNVGEYPVGAVLAVLNESALVGVYPTSSKPIGEIALESPLDFSLIMPLKLKPVVGIDIFLQFDSSSTPLSLASSRRVIDFASKNKQVLEELLKNNRNWSQDLYTPSKIFQRRRFNPWASKISRLSNEFEMMVDNTRDIR